MGWESDQEEALEKEPRDWGKLIWLGVFGVFILMIAALVMQPRPDVSVSKVLVKHILIQGIVKDPVSKEAAMKQIEQIQKWLEEGQSFENLAKEWSQDEDTKALGGSLGWVERDVLVSTMDSYIWTGPIGEVSQPIETQYGLHLVLIVDRKITEAELYERELQERVGSQGGNTE